MAARDASSGMWRTEFTGQNATSNGPGRPTAAAGEVNEARARAQPPGQRRDAEAVDGHGADDDQKDDPAQKRALVLLELVPHVLPLAVRRGGGHRASARSSGRGFPSRTLPVPGPALRARKCTRKVRIVKERMRFFAFPDLHRAAATAEIFQIL